MIVDKRGECVGVCFKTETNSRRRIKKAKYLNEGMWLSKVWTNDNDINVWVCSNSKRNKYLHTTYEYVSTNGKENVSTNVNGINIYNVRVRFYRST